MVGVITEKQWMGNREDVGVLLTGRSHTVPVVSAAAAAAAAAGRRAEVQLPQY